jgi:hypothetical protein
MSDDYQAMLQRALAKVEPLSDEQRAKLRGLLGDQSAPRDEDRDEAVEGADNA